MTETLLLFAMGLWAGFMVGYPLAAWCWRKYFVWYVRNFQSKKE